MLKKGFTLAEVLMTLAIIGVVSAITLPSLNYNITNQSLEKQTLKFYSQLHDGVMLDVADNSGGGFSLTDSFIKKNFNIMSICDSTNRATCLGDTLKGNDAKYKTLAGGTKTIPVSTFFPTTKNIYMLADGALFTADEASNTVTVDVNGSAPPNMYGRDLWVMTVFEDGTIDDANITTAIRTGSPATLKSYLDKNLSNCKSGKAPTFTTTTSSGGTTTETSSCLGTFIRNKFKFNW